MNKLLLMLAVGIMTTSFSKMPAGKSIHTLKITVDPSDWKLVGKSGVPGCYASDTIKCPDVTEAVFDNGAVLAYVLGTSGGGWYLLPHSYYTSGVEITTNFNFKTGYVELRMYQTDNGLAAPTIPLQYKIVIIPGKGKN